MTKKRFEKLCRAYFTRLNEQAKKRGNETMNMGMLYKNLHNLTNHLGVDEFGKERTREDWWKVLATNTNLFGVGIKTK